MRQIAVENPLPPRHERSGGTGVNALIDQALRELASWFERTPYSRNGSRTGVGRVELVLLLAILVAGIVVRFWGLGGVGLHGDEETMAMPTMHILEDGRPLLPSGMFYPRSIGQLYLMAGSVQLFGQSEWALRFPSAICGVLLILVAYFLGRRFLTAPWNLAFTAAVALLPDFIVAAQTARMYVFFVTSVAVFLLLLFKWEQTSRTGYLLGAVAALGVGLQFHTLTVFSAPLFLYPGLVQGDRRKTLLGAVAFIVVACAFLGVDAWIGGEYPESAPIDGVGPRREGAKAAWAIPHFTPLLWAASGVIAAAIAAFFVRGVDHRGTAGAGTVGGGTARGGAVGTGTAGVSTSMRGSVLLASDATVLRAAAAARSHRAMRWLAGVLLAGGLLAQILFAYHLASLLLVAGLVVVWRSGGVDRGRLLVFLLSSAAIAVAQVLALRANGVESFRLMAGAMTGRPSIWPYIIIGHYSVLAALLVAVAAVASLWRFAHRQPVPDFVLFLALGVWVPLLLIGSMKWWISARYTDGQALPLLLGALATAQWLMANASRRAQRDSLARGAVAALVCVAFVNPVAVARTVNSGYATHPDHKGAAEFIETIALAPNDILVAEDVLQQTYYLGRVDYWLVGKNIAQQFVHKVNGEVRDFYTNTRVLGSAADLQALLDTPGRGAIYVIGSGENQEDGRRNMRGFGIFEMLEKPPFMPIYEGRDHLTKIWKVPAPQAALATTEQPGANR